MCGASSRYYEESTMTTTIYGTGDDYTTLVSNRDVENVTKLAGHVKRRTTSSPSRNDVDVVIVGHKKNDEPRYVDWRYVNYVLRSDCVRATYQTRDTDGNVLNEKKKKIERIERRSTPHTALVTAPTSEPGTRAQWNNVHTRSLTPKQNV